MCLETHLAAHPAAGAIVVRNALIGMVIVSSYVAMGKLTLCSDSRLARYYNLLFE